MWSFLINNIIKNIQRQSTVRHVCNSPDKMSHNGKTSKFAAIKILEFDCEWVKIFFNHVLLSYSFSWLGRR